MNYGDYAYIEAFPGGGGQFFPDANRPRARQIFEIWIRPVKPEQAHHALRIAIHELEKLVQDGLTEEQFESTREYLSKNVFLMTASQSDQLGYALDSRWYGIGEFTEYMRAGLARLTLEDVNAAIRKHLQAENLAVVCVTKDAQGLRDQLVSDAPSAIAYDSTKSDELLAEDRVIGARKLGLTAEAVVVVPVERVFAD
jgi:zinc protease